MADRFQRNDLKHIAKLLKMAADEFGNHGCNDYAIENTPENQQLVIDLETWNDSNFDVSTLEFKGEEIYLMDWFLMSYFADLADAESPSFYEQGK